MEKFATLRAKAESMLTDARRIKTKPDIQDLKEIIHELDVYRIELEIQNDQLRESQAAFEMSRREFFELFEFAPIGYAVLNHDGRVEQINRAGALLFEGGKKKVMNARLSAFVLPPVAGFLKPFNEVLQSGNPRSTEVQFIRGKERFWAGLEFSILTQEDTQDSQKKKILCAVSDITEQKKAKEELAAHRDRLEILVKKRTRELEETNLRLQNEIESRKQSEAQIAASLREKEVLLRETHHRVKNNMQVISSLLNHQARKIREPKVREMFMESQSRIRAMSLIHETLYGQNCLAEINFRDYLSSLCENLFRIYVPRGSTPKLSVDTEDITLDIDRAVPCGLIVNELISNSLKYAFPEGRDGLIEISARSAENNCIELRIRDNGIGISGEIAPENTETMGLQMVFSLVNRQLGGTVSVKKDKGTAFTILFDRNKSKERIRDAHILPDTRK